MARPWKKGTLLASAALVGLLVMQGGTASADVTMTVTASVSSSISETIDTPMNFGTIDLDPGGDTVTIDASGAGSGAGGAAVANAAITFAGNSSTVGGTSGLVIIASANDVDIDVVYPLDGAATLTDGTTTAVLNNLDTYSGCGGTDTTCSKTGGTDFNIHIGGDLVFPAGSTNGAYTGDILIDINYS